MLSLIVVMSLEMIDFKFFMRIFDVTWVFYQEKTQNLIEKFRTFLYSKDIYGMSKYKFIHLQK